jgi:hypothetical protein
MAINWTKEKDQIYVTTFDSNGLTKKISQINIESKYNNNIILGIAYKLKNKTFLDETIIKSADYTFLTITNITKKFITINNINILYENLHDVLNQNGFCFITRELHTFLLEIIVYRGLYFLQQHFNQQKNIYNNRLIFIDCADTLQRLKKFANKYARSPLNLFNSSPSQILDNFFYIEIYKKYNKIINITPVTKKQKITGGLKYFNKITGIYNVLYEYDFNAFFPNIIIKNNLDIQHDLNDTPVLSTLMHSLMNNKPLRSQLYGLLGRYNSKIYTPETANKINQIARNEISSLKCEHTVIIATDAVFLTHQLNNIQTSYTMTCKIHKNLFVVNGSTYFNKNTISGFKKTNYTTLVRDNLLKILNNQENSFNETYFKFLSYFDNINSIITKPYNYQLKNEKIVNYKINDLTINDILISYILKDFLPIIYAVINWLHPHTYTYEEFKILYNILALTH